MDSPEMIELRETEKKLAVALHEYDDFTTLREAIRRIQKGLGQFIGAWDKETRK